MDKATLIKIAILLVLYDRVEFLYYLVEGSDVKLGFLLKGDPIRIDSYVYFASIGLQQVIFALIIHMLMPMKSVKFFVIASIICFLEYFVTYGQPITKIPLPWELYIPISGSMLRLASVCYFTWEVGKKIMQEE
jgi:hypothetical protein